ncbi:MAG TPA: alpha/beta hydrolase [Solirubrobacterales bacterium]|nr:alpha/beta hydrolase [Solirubrobacterales bacterium]
MILHRATDPHRDLGTIFLNQGGPAPTVSGFPFIYSLFPKSVQERFDIVTWDPRGLGGSNPLTCFSSRAAEDRFLAKTGLPVTNFPLPDSQINESISGFARLDLNCLHHSGRQLLEHMSTAESARDMEMLRRAFGEPKLDYYGLSYGTVLGDTYANLFPGRVRRMVLDANVTPMSWFTRRGGSFPGAEGTFLPTFMRQGSDLGAKKTLNAFLDLCGETTTVRCAFSAGSPAATRAKFTELLRRVQTEPWPGGPTYGEVVYETVAFIYGVEVWSALGGRLEELWNGHTPPALPTAEGPHDPFAGPYGIFCGESPNPGPNAFRRIEEYAAERSGPAGEYFNWTTLPCADWPVRAANPYHGPWDKPTANPILVVGTTHDPATPYENSVTMSHVLARARLLTVDGYGHAALPNAPCYLPYLARYLIGGTLPAPGTSCTGEQPFLEPGPK